MRYSARETYGFRIAHVLRPEILDEVCALKVQHLHYEIPTSELWQIQLPARHCALGWLTRGMHELMKNGCWSWSKSNVSISFVIISSVCCFHVRLLKWRFSYSLSVEWSHCSSPFCSFWTCRMLDIICAHISISLYHTCLFGVHSQLQALPYISQARGVQLRSVAKERLDTLSITSPQPHLRKQPYN